jgi:CheY-like chemotaxis protein
MGAPRILLVDDQRQVSRMLRSSLELSGREYIVIDVPSGEEALLELARGPVDLIVADLKLPGISGLDVVERARELNPSARAILITGHPTPEARARAESLGVVAFMAKPIRTSYFLEAVARALALSERPSGPPPSYDYDIQRLLGVLGRVQSEIAADSAILLDDKGRVVVQTHKLPGTMLESAIPALITAMRAGMKISGLLEGLMPTNIQIFNGETHDFYLTNVGAYYALLLVFRGGQAAAKLGAVMHYARKGVGELLDCLSEMAASQQVPEVIGEEGEAVLAGEEGREPPLDLEALGRESDAREAERFWDAAVSSAQGQPRLDGDALSFEQARKLGIVPDELEGEGDEA